MPAAPVPPTTLCRLLLVAGAASGTIAGSLPAQTEAVYENPPIEYGKQQPDDPVARLARRLGSGAASLRFDAGHGYLRALLRELQIPEASQGLVFSKTSFQNRFISPRSPRAVFFGDEVYVGFVPGGKVLEITAMDPRLGPVFYSLDQQPDRPRILRRAGECLSCHGSARTGHWPGHLVRSVFADHQGHPRTDAGSFVTTHDSPFAQRWGGWYVSGTHGEMRHMGNLTVGAGVSTADLDLDAGANLTDLREKFDADRYLSPHSDIVALMVLEHQTHMHNLLARAGYTVRRALHLKRETNLALGESADHLGESTERLLDRAAEEVLEYLLFKNEPPLPAPVAGTSDFAAVFQRRGPRDEKGRSLRDLDLRGRLFRYPCSYLIYSPSFDALPRPVLDRIYHRLGRILAGKASRREWRLTVAQRTAIREILVATKPGVPVSWGQPRR